MLYDYTIFPLECIYKIVYLGWYELLQSYGVALIALSFTAHIILAPLIEWGKRFQAEENRLQEILQPQIAAIKENFHGAAAHKELAWLYKRYGYHPAMSVRSAMMVLVQLPFLMAAYYMLLVLPDIEGVTFGAIADLSEPDGLLGGVNLLPIAMTLLNFGATFGQQNFSRRDRVQAVVIALLFLVLLYDAPSALLVYWTGNNFWMFAESVGQKSRRFVKIAAGLGAGQAKLWHTVKATCVPFALSLTLCLFVPLDFYLSNADEIWFTAPEILPYLSVATIAMWFLLSLPTKFLPQAGRNFYLAVLLGLTLDLFLQSYLLNPNYGQFNGADIQWDKYTGFGIINTIVWVVALFVCIGYVKRWLAYPHRINAFFAYGSTLIMVAQIIPLCYVGATQTIDKHHTNTLTTQNMLNISARDNIIVLVLDMFDTRFFREVRQETPELIDELDGFTYYPDAVSVFGLTAYSLPQMLTGAVYNNKQLYADFIADAWREHKFYRLLQQNNYDIGIYTTGIFVSDDAPVDNLVTAAQGKLMHINRHTLQVYGNLVLFRALPHFFKRYFVVYSGDLWQQEDTNAQIFDDDNLKFYHQLQRGLTLNNDKNAFRWYHIRGTHYPFNITRDLEPTDKEGSSQLDQSIGVMKIALAYLQQMKALGIYDKATIVLLADHGKHATGEEDDIDKYKPVPLVLVKQPGERGKLKKSNNPITFENLLATLAKRFDSAAVDFGTDFSIYDDKDRRFYYLVTADSNHPIIEYRVKPQAENNDSWEEVQTIPYEPRRKDNKYKLRTTIIFGTGQYSENYLGHGWGHPVEGGITTNDVVADLNLSVSNLKPGKDLLLSVTAGALVNRTQDIGVSVNGQPICVWRMDKAYWDEYTAIIPHSVLHGRDLHLEFSVSNPVKAWDAGKYFLLGFGLQKMTLTYAK